MTNFWSALYVSPSCCGDLATTAYAASFGAPGFELGLNQQAMVNVPSWTLSSTSELGMLTYRSLPSRATAPPNLPGTREGSLTRTPLLSRPEASSAVASASSSFQ